LRKHKGRKNPLKRGEGTQRLGRKKKRNWVTMEGDLVNNTHSLRLGGKKEMR